MKFNLHDDQSFQIPRSLKRVLFVVATIVFIMWAYGQYVSIFYLSKFNKYYSLNGNTVIYSDKNFNSNQVGFLKEWQAIMVPRKDKGQWVEVDKPEHGFVLFKELGTKNKMEKLKAEAYAKKKQKQLKH